jgi:hypothetical protein
MHHRYWYVKLDLAVICTKNIHLAHNIDVVYLDEHCFTYLHGVGCDINLKLGWTWLG